MKRGGPINRPIKKGKPWKGKLIRKLLLTMTVVDSERFTPKGKLVIFTRAFVEFYH